jgi:hypothetical protein
VLSWLGAALEYGWVNGAAWQLRVLEKKPGAQQGAAED